MAVVGILAVYQYFYPSATDVSTRGTGLGRPGPWLSDLVEYHMWTMVTLMPAGLVSLTVAPFDNPYGPYLGLTWHKRDFR